ncbi:MAG: hypothetical protein AAF085_00510 [Planctomycetota bacterium]
MGHRPEHDMGMQELRYWLEDLELRKKLEENQSVVVIGLVVVILFCLGVVACQLMGGGPGAGSSDVRLVYFDMDSQTVRIIDHTYPDLPTSPLEGTESVYIASVFSCEDCPKGKIKDGMTLEELKAEGMFVAWLEKRDPEVSEEMAMFGEGYSYRSLENDRWYKNTERGYEAIHAKLVERCSQARICLP